MFGIEPVLQKLSGGHLKHKTSISSDDVSLDIIADNFWGHNRKRTYFDVRVFNLLFYFPQCPITTATAMPKWKRNGHMNNGFVKSSLVPFPH